MQIYKWPQVSSIWMGVDIGMRTLHGFGQWIYSKTPIWVTGCLNVSNQIFSAVIFCWFVRQFITSSGCKQRQHVTIGQRKWNFRHANFNGQWYSFKPSLIPGRGSTTRVWKMGSLAMQVILYAKPKYTPGCGMNVRHSSLPILTIVVYNVFFHTYHALCRIMTCGTMAFHFHTVEYVFSTYVTWGYTKCPGETKFFCSYICSTHPLSPCVTLQVAEPANLMN